MCVQKTSEASALVAGGVYNIFITNEVIAPTKLARVAQLSRTLAPLGGKLAICVDSLEGVKRLAQCMNEGRVLSSIASTIDVFIELDVGQNRCGVEPGEAAVALALRIRKHPALNLPGCRPTTARRSTCAAQQTAKVLLSKPSNRSAARAS